MLYLGNTNRRSPSFRDRDKSTHVTSVTLRDPQVHRQREGTGKSTSTEESFSIDQQAKSDRRISQLVELTEQLEAIHRESTRKERTETAHSQETSEVAADSQRDFEQASGPLEECLQAELEETRLSLDLVNSLDHADLPQGREILQSPTDSTTTPSEVSTVIARDLASSRCSGSFFGSDGEEGTSSGAVTGTELLERRDSPSVRNPTSLVFTDSALTPSAVLFSGTQEDLQYSPAQLSNPTGAPTHDSTGLFPLEFRNSGSQGTVSVSYFSPRYTDATFHYDLSQSQPEESGNDLGFENARNSDSSFGESTSSPPQVAPPPGFEGSHLALIDEEPAATESRLQSSSHPHLHNGYSNGPPGANFTQSNRSSVSSIDSIANSIIVVSYNTDCAGEKVSDLHGPTPPSSGSSYIGGDDVFNPSLVPAERKEFAKTSPFFSTTDTRLGADLEMAGRAEVMTIVPPIPHHSLNVSTSSSPPNHTSSPPHLSRGFPVQPHKSPSRVPRTLYVVPSGSAQKIRATDVFGESPHKDEVKRGFKEVKVSVVLLPGEKRLGFNVVGGKDQGTHLRVGAIAGCKYNQGDGMSEPSLVPRLYLHVSYPDPNPNLASFPGFTCTFHIQTGKCMKLVVHALSIRRQV